MWRPSGRSTLHPYGSDVAACVGADVEPKDSPPDSNRAANPSALLAVDLGLRAGLALYGEDGRLHSYRSHNFGSLPRLRAGAARILHEHPGLAWLVIEGGGVAAEAWARAAAKRALPVLQISAETWRAAVLLDREQRSGAVAKQHADTLARRVIGWSHAPKPTSLRHDAAEAILLGLWACVEVGWLPALPTDLRRLGS